MFNLASFFVGIKFKLVALGIISTLLLAFYWSWSSRGAEVKKLEAKEAVMAVSNTSLEKTIVEEKVNASITERINTEVAKDEVIIATRQDDITAKRRIAVATIDKTFAALPATPANTAERDSETSAVLIDGLWGSFCSGQPDHAKCPAH